MTRFKAQPRKGTIAGVYDCLLGGESHSVLDHEMAQRILQKYPNARNAVIANRAFLRRAVTYVSRQQVMQFLDFGSGLPTVENTHQIAQAINPDARVVYIDNDEIATARSQFLLSREKNTAAINRDVRQPLDLFSDPMLSRAIDFTQPVAFVMVALFHFLRDDEITGILTAVRDHAVPGSYLILSHGTRPDVAADVVDEIENTYGRFINNVYLRSEGEISEFFKGFELVEPKIVYTPEWHPDIDSGYLPPDYEPFKSEEAWRTLAFAGVGVKV